MALFNCVCVCMSTHAHMGTGLHVSMCELSPSAYRSSKGELDPPATRVIGGHDPSNLGTGTQTGVIFLTAEASLQLHM